MINRITLVFLIICLISGVVLAKDSQSINIKLAATDLGHTLTANDIDWPNWVCEKIDLANQGKGQFVVTIVSDSTVQWNLVHWLKSQSGTEHFNFPDLNSVLDASAMKARETNFTRILKSLGLSKSAMTFSSDFGGQVEIIIVFEEEQDSESNTDNSSHTDTSSTDTSSNSHSTNTDEDFVWNLRVGGELTAVTDGKPVIAPAISLEASKENYLLRATIAYRPKNSVLDQKFFAGSVAYFPEGKNLGPMFRIIYASESIKTHNAYLQQGFGLTAGAMLRSENINFHLTGGVQYFDRYQEDRRIEPTINFGLSIKVKSF